MASNIDLCVKQILCGLSRVVLNALNALITTYIGAFEAQIAVWEAALLQFDILSAPIVIADQAVQAALAQIRAGANIIPLSVIGTCLGVNDLTRDIRKNIDALSADVAAIADDLARQLSYKDELEALIAEANSIIEYYRSIQVVIQACP